VARLRTANPKNTSGGYERVFGNPELGLLARKIQSAVVSSGAELERMAAAEVSNVPDLDAFLARQAMREGVRHDGGVLQDLHHRPGPQAVGKLTATGETRGESGTGTRRFPMGGRPCPERFPGTARPHRAVEDSPHRVPDVAMDGDSRRTRTDGGQGNLAPMRRRAPDAAGTAPGQEAMRGKPEKAGWSDGALIGLVRATVRLKPPQRKS